MPVLTKEDFMTKLQELIGDRTDDEALATIENFSETYDYLGATTNDDALKALDEEWRRKYRDAFFAKPEETDEKPGDEPEDEFNENYDELFEEVK